MVDEVEIRFSFGDSLKEDKGDYKFQKRRAEKIGVFYL
jgi:hypothetical protein